MYTITNTSAEADSMLESFRCDVVIAVVHHLRVTAWMEGHERIPAIWEAAGIAPDSPDEIYNPDWTVADWGLKWEDVAGLDFAIYLDNMFQYGQFGLLDMGWEPMEEGTGYTWTSLILMDMQNSKFLQDWSEGYSGEGAESVARCLEAAELANARYVLETGDPFCYQLSAKERGDEKGVDGLTVRQVALLAGMEEMSVRAAANPKRANFLQTFSDNGRTRVKQQVAKSWLQSKGRHLEIKGVDSGRNNELRKRPFKNQAELVQKLRARAISLCVTHGCGLAASDARVLDFLESGEHIFSENPAWEPGQQRAALHDPSFVQALAENLAMPADLLSLRVREVLAKEELQSIQQSLREISLPSGGEHA